MEETDVDKISILGKESIHCGFHLVPYIVHTVLTTLPASTYFLITDSTVAALHLHKFVEQFQSALAHTSGTGAGAASDARFLVHVVPPGETSKSRQAKADIEDVLLHHKCTRDTVLLALGGGVVGDLAGFVAATLYVLAFLFHSSLSLHSH